MRASAFPLRLATVLCLLLLGQLATARDGDAVSFETVFASYVKEGRLVDAMRNELLAASEAEKSSVMAETDEASIAYATQAREHAAALNAAKAELVELVTRLNLGKEKALLASFDQAWLEYQQLDKQILELAVLNTNLKAKRLLYGTCLTLLDKLEDALAAGRDASGAPESARALALAGQALTDAYKIQSLLAPHIESPDALVMDALEKRIRGLDQRLVKALDELAAQATAPEAKTARGRAVSLYREYAQLTQQIISLSRRNSNVISLSLSLGQKRKITARCLELLDALKQISQDKEFKATR